MLTIFTICFTGKSVKTYDYLVSNPNHYDIDMTKLLRFVIGSDHGGLRYSTARIARVSHPDSLPYHVTACLDVNIDNTVVSRRLDDTQLAKLRALKPAPVTTKPVALRPIKTPIVTPKAEPTVSHVLTERELQLIASYEQKIREAEEEDRTIHYWADGRVHQKHTQEIVRWKIHIKNIKEGKYECI